MELPTCILITVTAAVVIGMRVGWTARHTLVVQSVQMQRVRAGYAGILSRTTARTTALVARLARLLRWLVVL